MITTATLTKLIFIIIKIKTIHLKNTYRHFQDFVEHHIWRNVEVKHKILEKIKVCHICHL